MAKTLAGVASPAYWVWLVGIPFTHAGDTSADIYSVPASSIILSEVSGTTGSNPDGATFLDNLFGSGEDAPAQKLFSLSLARREDIRTSSFLGIGAVSSTLCPSPCSPPYLPIIAKPSLGAVGFLHWRIQIQSISAMTWSDPQHASGMNTTMIELGPSQVDAAKSSPLAVLDSGGVAILVGYKPYADAIYAAYGISASSDGYCECSRTARSRQQSLTALI